MERMAAGYTLYRKPSAFEKSVFLKCGSGIFRAAWFKLTNIAKERGERSFVKPEQSRIDIS